MLLHILIPLDWSSYFLNVFADPQKLVGICMWEPFIFKNHRDNNKGREKSSLEVDTEW